MDDSKFATKKQHSNLTQAMIDGFESRIVQAFARGDCDTVQQAADRETVLMFQPLVRAVGAYCGIVGVDSEGLFEGAESAAPSNDLIVFLHARFIWKINPKAAEPLFRKTILLARSPSIQQIAQDYLAGEVQEEQTGFTTKKYTYFINAQAGVSRETNPLSLSFSDPQRLPSDAINDQLYLSAQRNLKFGSISANYTLVNNNYPSEQDANLVSQNIELPLAVRVGSNEDLVVRAFGGYSFLGRYPYQSTEGFGIMGVAYHTNYRQSVQGMIYWDKLYPQPLNNQDGTHFRFEYDWEFFPKNLLFRLNTYLEHQKAAADQDFDPTLPQNIPYSHNELGVQVFADYDLGKAVVGLYPKIAFRLDDQDSRYPSNPSLIQVAKTRQDWTFDLQTNVAIPIHAGIQFVAWYEFYRILSNLGPNDYLDRNVLNETAGIALRAAISRL